MTAPERVTAAIAALEALGDERARTVAGDAVAALLDVHREGLARLAERLRAAGPEAARAFEAAAQDELVGSLLLLHGVHPLPVEARVRWALARVRAEHGGTAHADILAADDASVRLSVSGGEAVRRAVQRAVEEVVPDVARVEVVSTPADLVPLSRLTARRETTHDRCDLCAQGVDPGHAHLFDAGKRRVVCACRACGLLFDAAHSRYRQIPPLAEPVDVRLDAALWDALGVPVGLAFFSRSSARGGAVVATYPAPGGSVEADVPAAAWESLERACPAAATMPEDVAALLVDRISAPPRAWLLSIDQCFRLVGLVRMRWEGMTGGDGVRRALDELYADLGEVRP